MYVAELTCMYLVGYWFIYIYITSCLALTIAM